MKKRILLVISLILVLTLAICGCNNQPETAYSSSLEETHISSLDIESNNNKTSEEDKESSNYSSNTEAHTSKSSSSKKHPSEKPVISKPNSSKISSVQGNISNSTSSKKDNGPSSSSSKKPDISSNTNKPDARTVNLTKGIAPSGVSGKDADNIFLNAQANFAVNLFKQTANNDKNKNVLISPLSAEIVLAMAFNGADGETKKEFEKAMGGITLEQLNKYLYSYINSLDDSEIKLNIANSIWIKNGLPVKEEFLKANKNYYDSEIFGTEFDDNTIKDINKWASDNTDNMIEKLLKKSDIDKSTVMCLINALLFDADWEWKYSHSDATQTFTNINGEKKEPQTLRCYAYDYYDDGKATGFKKDYIGNNFSFVALLPNEDVNINDYINGLTGEELLNTLNNPKEVRTNTQMPEFTYECDYDMIPSFKELGIISAFDSNKADFSKISNSLYISNFIHKTKISVNEVGTKAAAASAATMTKSGMQSQEHKVIIDRPFIYMIIDNKTNLPVFIGTVMDA